MAQIVVIGMHESGVSAAAHLLGCMGACTGDARRVGGTAPHGRRDAWENPDLRRLNDRVLAALGNSWADCGQLGLSAMPQSEQRHFRRVAGDILEALAAHSCGVIGDPRLSLLLDLWKPLLTQPIFLLIHRPPAEVARSLRAHHGIPFELGLALWERYNLAALAGSAGLPRILCSAEPLLECTGQAAWQLHQELDALGAESLRLPTDEALQQCIEFAPQAIARREGEATINQQQLDLAAALEDGSALDQDAPAISATATAALERAGNRWPGQRWMKRLLRERDAQLHDRRKELQALRKETAKLRLNSALRLGSPANGRSRGVFVVGCPRSGTSVFSWALAQHPNFWTSAESDYLLDIFGPQRVRDAYQQACQRSDGSWLKKQDVSFAEFAASIGFGIEQLFESRSGGRRWVDATPGYTLMIEDLLGFFPAASFLHIIRDGRAVVNSMISSGFDIDWASDFSAACRTWVHYLSAGRQAAGAHPQRVLNVRYDRLTSNPQSELARVFEFLGEQPSRRSAELILTKRINSSYGNLDAKDIRLPKNPATAPKRPWEAWNEEQQRIFSEIAGEAMAELGYQEGLAG